MAPGTKARTSARTKARTSARASTGALLTAAKTSECLLGGTAQRETRGNLGCQRRLLRTRHVREGRGTEGRGTEVGGEDLAIYWFDVRPGGPRDGGHEGTADCGPEGVLRVHRGLVQREGADEARVKLTEEAGNGPRAAVDGGVLEAEGFGGGGSWC